MAEPTDPTGPADTRMMGIVHGALKRDLLRARETASSSSPPAGRQRRALGEHVVWLMDFLHRHHTSEDEGLWPAVRTKNPDAGPLLDSLETDHRRIEPAAATLRETAERYASTDDDGARGELVTALDELAEVLFPHLDREVADAMPVVSATLTDREWREIDEEHNIKPKSLSELGFEGHWLLDGIDAEGYRIVTGVVPAVPRFILLHGFRRSYRRHLAKVWQPDPVARDTAVR